MLYSLRGAVVHTDQSSIAVECGGVAYLCQTTYGTLSKCSGGKGEVTLYTYLHVREGAVDLFGFADQGELSCFKMLIGVSGVGPKVGLSILSRLSPERFALCVASGDYKSITAAQGVGPKLAQRIVLELRDKVQNADVAKGISSLPAGISVEGGNAGEAISALVVLGYSQGEAASAIAKMAPGSSVEDMIKAGLKVLAGRT